MFEFEGNRVHTDCFVNTHNEVSSIVFGANTNVVCFVTGGSCMYITLYVSKDTQKDDKKAYADGAKIMVRKLNEKIEKLEECDEEEIDSAMGEKDEMLAGMRALIGASFIATRSRQVSAPMAAFLTRNHSRFQFSHQFESADLKDFYKEEVKDFTIDSDEDGIPFKKSKVLFFCIF